MGGSLALLENGRTLASHVGDAAASRAEELLPNIDSLLEAAGRKKIQIGEIRVSIGPGSFTGLRIGISTALGLTAALKTELFGVPVLSAIYETFGNGELAIAAVPLGKRDVCLQTFSGKEPNGGTITVLSAAAVSPEQLSSTAKVLIMHPSLSGRLSPEICDKIQVVETDENLAELIGRSSFISPGVEPIYVSAER